MSTEPGRRDPQAARARPFPVAHGAGQWVLLTMDLAEGLRQGQPGWSIQLGLWDEPDLPPRLAPLSWGDTGPFSSRALAV